MQFETTSFLAGLIGGFPLGFLARWFIWKPQKLRGGSVEWGAPAFDCTKPDGTHLFVKVQWDNTDTLKGVWYKVYQRKCPSTIPSDPSSESATQSSSSASTSPASLDIPIGNITSGYILVWVRFTNSSGSYYVATRTCCLLSCP